MKTILTLLLILFVSINTQAQLPTLVLIKTNTDSVLNDLNRRTTKLETDTVGVGVGLDYNRLTKVFSVNQSVLNQLSTMQATILTLQAANEALRVRLAGLKITATVQ